MNTMMILLLISGGALVVVGMATGAILIRYGIGIGNKITFNALNDTPLNEEIITITQENTE